MRRRTMKTVTKFGTIIAQSSPSFLRGIDHAHADHSQGSHARHEEIFAAASLDELRNAFDDERGVAGCWIGGDHELRLGAIFAAGRSVRMISNDRACIAAGMRIEPIVDPLLLHEFELPEQARANDQHHKSLLVLVQPSIWRVAVRQAAPENTAAIVQNRTVVAGRGHHIAGIYSPHMGGERAFGSLWIVAKTEIRESRVAGLRVGRWMINVELVPQRHGWRERKRHPVWPAPSHLRH